MLTVHFALLSKSAWLSYFVNQPNCQRSRRSIFTSGNHASLRPWIDYWGLKEIKMVWSSLPLQILVNAFWSNQCPTVFQALVNKIMQNMLNRLFFMDIVIKKTKCHSTCLSRETRTRCWTGTLGLKSSC